MSETSKIRGFLSDYFLREFFPGVELYSKWNFLDIGCGMDKLFPRAIGVDRHPYDGVNLIWEMPPTGELPFEAETFDVVYSSHTLEDFEDTSAVLGSWKSLVKPGGRIILYLPHADYYPNIGEEHANAAHKHDFRPDDIWRPELFDPGDWELELLTENAPPDGVYDYENRGEIEYSFLIVARKRQ